jgi:tetratricopeptide (TPR) repeat protein
MPKKKDPKKDRRPNRNIQIQFPDKTAERYLQSQLSRGEKLFEAGRFEEGLQVLEPLLQRNPGHLPLLELIGATYGSLGYRAEAQAAFEAALALPGQKAGALTLFNLVQTYVLNDYPFLAYNMSQELDCQALALETRQPSNLELCRDLAENCRQLIETAAEENGREAAMFEPVGLALDRGRLALSKEDYGTARQFFQEAVQLDGELVIALNNLALACLLDNALSEAENAARQVVEHIEPQNRAALSLLVRLAAIRNDKDAAETHLEKLAALPTPLAFAERLKLAEAYAALDRDEQLLNSVRPMLEIDPVNLLLDEPSYEELVTFGTVAAANLGQNLLAMKFLQEARKFTRPTLLERTLFALENNERGPRPDGRFFYYDPVAAFPPASAYFTNLASQLQASGSNDYREGLRQFYREFGPAALEVAAYKYWIDREPAVVADLLSQALASGVDGAGEMVRRLAFSRAGDDLQRVTAAEVLREAGIIEPEERVKIWLGQRQAIGTVAQLSQRQREIARRPASPELDHQIASQLNQALDAMRQGDRTGALNRYRQIVEHNPRLKQAYQNLAALLSGQGDTEGAIGYLRQALQVDPAYTPAQLALAQLLIASGQLEEARKWLDTLEGNLADFYLDELEAYYLALASYYRKQGQSGEAVTALQELLAADPENRPAQALLAQFEQANGRETETD